MYYTRWPKSEWSKYKKLQAVTGISCSSSHPDTAVKSAMDDIENVVDVIAAIREGDYEVVSQAIDQNHVAATALDQEGNSQGMPQLWLAGRMQSALVFVNMKRGIHRKYLLMYYRVFKLDSDECTTSHWLFMLLQANWIIFSISRGGEGKIRRD